MQVQLVFVVDQVGGSAVEIGVYRKTTVTRIQRLVYQIATAGDCRDDAIRCDLTNTPAGTNV